MYHFPISLIRRMNVRSSMEKASQALDACMVAATHDPSFTEIVYAHLNPTTGMLPIVTIHGPAFRQWRTSLDNYRFVIQKKAISFKDSLLEVRSDPNLFAARIDSYLRLAKNRLSSGILNRDPPTPKNLGFCEGHAIDLDFGKYEKPDYSSAAIELETEWSCFVSWLINWVKKFSPEQAEALALKGYSEKDLLRDLAQHP